MTQALAHQGFGDDLCSIVKDLHGSELTAFIQQWWVDLIVCLHDDPFKLFKRWHPSIADAIPSMFPSIYVIYSFLTPVVSGRDAFANLSWPLHLLNLAELTRLCE